MDRDRRDFTGGPLRLSSGGMRVGGVSRNKSAVKVAMNAAIRTIPRKAPDVLPDRRSLKRLRHMVPAGPKDEVNVDKTIYQTMKNAGEIEIVFDRGLRDRLKVILAIDNGGWSMDPYIELCQTLFNYARPSSRSETFFFHNTIYDYLFEDPPRRSKPFPVDQLTGWTLKPASSSWGTPACAL